MLNPVHSDTIRWPGLIGRKIGMTRVFTEEGLSIPVTVLDVSNNRVVQVKSLKTDGYSAIQITWGISRASRMSRAQAGHYSKSNVKFGNILREFRVSVYETEKITVGSVINIESAFRLGQYVDVTGITIGKGFSGNIKRHGFKSQRSSHGNSRAHRAPGSIGGTQDPGRVFPGKSMAGQLGNVTRTIQNIVIVRIDPTRGLLLVKGSVPGCIGSQIIVRPAVKKLNKIGVTI